MVGFELRNIHLAEQAAAGLAGCNEANNIRVLSCAGEISHHKILRSKLVINLLNR